MQPKLPNKGKLQSTTINKSSDSDFEKFKKIYQNFTKRPFPHLVSDTALEAQNHFNREKLTVEEAGFKVNFGLDRNTTNILAMQFKDP